MCFQGGATNVELPCNRGPVDAIAEQPNNFSLARRQEFVFDGKARIAGEMFQNADGERGLD